MTTSQKLRLAGLIAFTGLSVYLLATEAHKAILRPLWSAFSAYLDYLFA